MRQNKKLLIFVLILGVFLVCGGGFWYKKKLKNSKKVESIFPLEKNKNLERKSNTILPSLKQKESSTKKSEKKSSNVQNFSSEKINFAGFSILEGSREVGQDKTDDFEERDYKISKSPEEILNFYKNKLVEQGWRVNFVSEEMLFLEKEGAKVDVIISSFDGKESIYQIVYWFKK